VKIEGLFLQSAPNKTPCVSLMERDHLRVEFKITRFQNSIKIVVGIFFSFINMLGPSYLFLTQEEPGTLHVLKRNWTVAHQMGEKYCVQA
jgi:hypothetical protein